VIPVNAKRTHFRFLNFTRKRSLEILKLSPRYSLSYGYQLEPQLSREASSSMSQWNRKSAKLKKLPKPDRVAEFIDAAAGTAQ
jgi:hypothetical protein